MSRAITIHSSCTLIVAVQLSCTICCVCCSTYSAAAACVHCSTSRAMPTIHSRYIFIRLYSYHVQHCCVSTTAASAAACALLNKQSHANHSVQLYIFDCSCSYHVHNLLRAACCSSTAVRCVHVHCSQAEPCQPFIPAVHLVCGCTVIMYTICCVL
jgi:hypothetical protein